MDKKVQLEKRRILKEPCENPILNVANDDIGVIPNLGVSIAEEIAVTYGPDPMLIDEIACNEEAQMEFVVDVDSDMYGGPLPEDFYREDLDLTELTYVDELIVDESFESDDKGNEKRAD